MSLELAERRNSGTHSTAPPLPTVESVHTLPHLEESTFHEPHPLCHYTLWKVGRQTGRYEVRSFKSRRTRTQRVWLSIYMTGLRPLLGFKRPLFFTRKFVPLFVFCERKVNMVFTTILIWFEGPFDLW